MVEGGGKGFLETLKDNRKKAVAWLFFLVFLVFLYKAATVVFLVLLSLGAALFVSFFGFRWTGIEFTTLAVVLIGAAFGPKAGGIMGFILITLQLLLGQYINAYVLWVIPGYTVAGVIAGFQGVSDIAGLGIMITAGLHVVFSAFTAFFTPGNLPRYLPYAALNLIFNVFMFTTIGPVLAGYLV